MRTVEEGLGASAKAKMFSVSSYYLKLKLVEEIVLTRVYQNRSDQ